MKKRHVLVIFVSVIYALSIVLNPLRRPVGNIRENILELTPIGSNMEDVMIVIKDNIKWRFMGGSYEYGYVNYTYAPGSRTVGVKHLTAELGKSSYFWYVVVSWGFDENSKLIDVYVTKSLDI